MPTLEQAVEMCRKIEALCPPFGFHVALTGGCLYKDGIRKDMDVLFYRIRQVPPEQADSDALMVELCKAGIFENYTGFGWCYKAVTKHKESVDCFFPEEKRGMIYGEEDTDE